MIEFTFGESLAGALKFAKSMQPGKRIQGAVSVIGGNARQRRALKRPRIWTGEALEGNAADVYPLTLALDIGDISSIGDRYAILEQLYGRYAGVAPEMAATNHRALERLDQCRASLEPVRLWVSATDPAELCGLYYVCHLLRDVEAPLHVVFIPTFTETESTISEYRSSGEVPAELLGSFARDAEALSALRKTFYAGEWMRLAQENAPLRAYINGKVMGVEAEFYDTFLRRNMPQDAFRVARVLGKTLGELPSVGDAWLYLRLQAMVRAGELEEVAPPDGDHPYSGLLQVRQLP